MPESTIDHTGTIFTPSNCTAYQVVNDSASASKLGVRVSGMHATDGSEDLVLAAGDAPLILRYGWNKVASIFLYAVTAGSTCTVRHGKVVQSPSGSVL